MRRGVGRGRAPNGGQGVGDNAGGEGVHRLVQQVDDEFTARPGLWRGADAGGVLQHLVAGDTDDGELPRRPGPAQPGVRHPRPQNPEEGALSHVHGQVNRHRLAARILPHAGQTFHGPGGNVGVGPAGRPLLHLLPQRHHQHAGGAGHCSLPQRALHHAATSTQAPRSTCSLWFAAVTVSSESARKPGARRWPPGTATGRPPARRPGATARAAKRSVAAGLHADGLDARVGAASAGSFAQFRGDVGGGVRQAIHACRKAGTVFILGVFAGAVDMFPLGAEINEGLTVRGAQMHGQRYIPMLLDRLASERSRRPTW